MNLSARGARVSGDFRALELDDASVLLPSSPPVAVRVGRLSLHGMAPFARASTLSALARAVVMGLSAWLAASVAAYAMLLRGARSGTRARAIVVGAVGPIAALGLVRLLEASNARPLAFAAVPLAAGASAALAAAAAQPLSRVVRAAYRLRGRTAAATSQS